MKRALVALVIGLAACAPEAPPENAGQTPAEQTPPTQLVGCQAETSRDWSAVGSQYYVVEARARGETCRDATATIRILSRDGAVLFTRDYPTAQVPLAFSPASDQTTLRTELEAWTENTSSTQRTDELPAWPARADRPPHFQPAVTRNQYENARGAQGAMFCYPDGGESNACVALAGDTATFLGSLTPERE